MELRGMTENVLIWVEESASYSRYQGAGTGGARRSRKSCGPLQTTIRTIQNRPVLMAIHA